MVFWDVILYSTVDRSKVSEVPPSSGYSGSFIQIFQSTSRFLRNGFIHQANDAVSHRRRRQELVLTAMRAADFKEQQMIFPTRHRFAHSFTLSFNTTNYKQARIVSIHCWGLLYNNECHDKNNKYSEHGLGLSYYNPTPVLSWVFFPLMQHDHFNHVVSKCHIFRSFDCK
jgi:hypothetical protein